MSAHIDPLLSHSHTSAARSARSIPVRPSERVFRRRRRRLVGATMVFGLTTALVSTGVFATVSTGAFATPTPSNQTVPRTVIAQPGDTLWGIARDIAPKGNISNLVSELVRANGSHIEPGQVIRIP